MSRKWNILIAQVSWPLELIANTEAIKKYNQVFVSTFGASICGIRNFLLIQCDVNTL